MGRWVTPFIGEQLDDGVHWRLTNTLSYLDDVLGLRSAPVGFVTDGGSVPALFQDFVNPYGKGLKAFALHDWEYGTQSLSREQADELLQRMLKDSGEDWIADGLQFDAVRLGGEVAWEDDKKNIAANLALLVKPEE